MLTTNAIVLSKIRYRDNDLIIKCYTQEKGLVSYLLRGVLKSKKGKTRPAYFQLLSQLQIVAIHKSNRSLQTIKEVKLNYLYCSLHTEVIKSSIALFLAEVLTNSLKEEEQNEILFSYLETTFQWLDNHTEFSNFHLLFLLNLTKHLGFYPDSSNINYPFFNLKEGSLVKKNIDSYTISDENFMILKQLLGTTFDTLSSIRINSLERQSFLSMILLYFELHLGNFKKPKSLQILNQVFS